MKKYLFLLLLAVSATACKKDSEGEIDPPAPLDKPVWESYTHAQLLKFKGAVKAVHEYLEEDGEKYEQLSASFDAAGNCTYYNGTGIDPAVATYGWGTEAIWYEYRYDASGRMSSVIRYEVGADPLTYTITYGSHGSYVVAPFALGDIEPFMLKGVVRIEADDYLLTCDGKAAHSESVTSGWMASTTTAEWTITDGMPAALESITMRGDVEMAHVRTTYRYEKNRLTDQTSVISGPESTKAETVLYSAVWPCSPVKRIISYSAVPEDQTTVSYSYAENGLITGVAVSGVVSDEVEDPFLQWYNAYDVQGNWTSSTKQIDGMDLVLTRTVDYHR